MSIEKYDIVPNHRNVYIPLATSISKTGKFQLTHLVNENGFMKILKSTINWDLTVPVKGFSNLVIENCTYFNI